MRGFQILAATTLVACGSSTPEPETGTSGGSGAPQAHTTPTAGSHESGLGRLHGDALALARSARGVERIELQLDDDDDVTQIAVYHDDEDEIPEPVLSLADKEFPDHEVRVFETEWHGSKRRVYEVELITDDGRECEVSARSDGGLEYVECEISPQELPESVANSVVEILPKGELVEAERKEGPDTDQFCLEVRVEDKLHYLALRPSGELVAHRLVFDAELEGPAR